MSPTIKYMTDIAKGLPTGWRVEIRTRASGNRAGSKYMCYIAPITGCKFYSKGQVARYLKTRPKQEQIIYRNSEKHVVFVEQKDMVDGLPPGWTMELKFTRSGNGSRIRSDPYYIDRVSGHVFRSKKDVFRYIKTGELGKHAFKAKGDIKNGKQLRVEPSPSLATGREKLKGSLIKEHLTTGQCSKSDESVKDEPVMDSSTALGEDNIPLIRLTPINTKRFKKRKLKKAIIKKALLSTCLTDAPSPKNQLEEDGKEEDDNTKTQLSSTKRRNEVELDSSRRISKRIAGINAKPVGNMVRPNETPTTVLLPPGESKLVVHPTSPCLVAEPLNQLEDEKEGKTTHVGDEDPHKHEKCHAENVEQTTTVEATNLIRPSETPPITIGIDPISSLVSDPLNQLGSENEGKFPVHAARDEDPHTHGTDSETIKHRTTIEGVRSGGEEIIEQRASNIKAEEISTELCEHTTGKVKIEEQGNEKLECDIALPLELCQDPCLEFAFKTLTGEIPVEDKDVKIPTLDPCLEFAYKTLTGDIPMEVNLTVSGAIPTSDPCIEFAYNTLTGAMQEAAAADQTVEIPFPIPTSDPCLEFAYKTLTGEIPVGDSLATQNYYQHQLGSAQKQTSQNNTVEFPRYNQNDFHISNFFCFETAMPASSSAKGPASESTLSCGNGIVEHPSMDGKMGHRRR